MKNRVVGDVCKESTIQVPGATILKAQGDRNVGPLQNIPIHGFFHILRISNSMFRTAIRFSFF